METPAKQAPPSRRPARAGAAALLCVATLLLGLQAASISRASIHWDEFALLHLADLTQATGELHAGGRPGLAVALLLPLVADCTDEIAVAQRARWLWLGIGAALVGGVWSWLAALGGERRQRSFDAALGTALLVLPPAFLTASLQVRTDLIALAGGAWGGALLLHSRRYPWLALPAGACFGIGLLGSQKLLYVAALAGLLAAGQQWLERSFAWRREALRGLALACGGAAVVMGFRLWAELAFVVPEASHVRQPIAPELVSSGLSLFEFYRQSLGWLEYRSLLPELVPHGALVLVLLVATALAVRRRSDDAARLLLACTVLALGLAVALFHAAAFRYFWLTLGLFPAAAAALARGPLAARTPPRLRTPAVALLCLALALPLAPHVAAAFGDPQSVQRESLGFVHRNFPRETAGFHPESALVCQSGTQPLRTYFSQHIHQEFESPQRERNIARLMHRFREREISFLLQSFRLNQFPVEMRRFWSDNYQPYRASVFVAGRRLAGDAGERVDFELVVPGTYRWLPLDGPQPLGIGERVIAPGGVIELAAGPQSARFLEPVPRGMLLLALDEPPGRAPLAFYGSP